MDFRIPNPNPNPTAREVLILVHDWLFGCVLVGTSLSQARTLGGGDSRSAGSSHATGTDKTTPLLLDGGRSGKKDYLI